MVRAVTSGMEFDRQLKSVLRTNPHLCIVRHTSDFAIKNSLTAAGGLTENTISGSKTTRV